MLDALRGVLEADERVTYAVVFGSWARESARTARDVDIAIGLRPGVRLAAQEIGALVSRLEATTGQTVDLVLLDEAPCAVAYRVFRDSVPIFTRDRAAMVERKTRAILEYLDFRPIEELCSRGVAAAATRGR